jgi:hypothetical protein
MNAWVYDDGGRILAGYRGETRDCVCRSIAIVQAHLTGKPKGEAYIETYRALAARCRTGESPRTGIRKAIYKRLLAEWGWLWTPTMGIGTGTKIHLCAGELPSGPLVVSTSRHLVAVIDGVVRDTHDSTRDGTRCVYGYWQPVAP